MRAGFAPPAASSVTSADACSDTSAASVRSTHADPGSDRTKAVTRTTMNTTHSTGIRRVMRGGACRTGARLLLRRLGVAALGFLLGMGTRQRANALTSVRDQMATIVLLAGERCRKYREMLNTDRPPELIRRTPDPVTPCPAAGAVRLYIQSVSVSLVILMQPLHFSAVSDARRLCEFSHANAAHLGAAHPEPPSLRLPLIASPSPQAGFPSPAADYVEETLDLNELMIRNPPATFFVRVKGESMTDAKIFEGDVLCVDRSIDPRPGHVVVASYSGDLYVKRLSRLSGDRLALISENAAQREQYPILYLDQAEDCTLWGVVTGSVRRF